MIHRALAGAVLGAIAACFALVACGGDPPALKDTPGSDIEVLPAPPSQEAPDPAAIVIPQIGVRSTLIPLGLTEAGELAVPPVETPMQASWYAGADPDPHLGQGDEYDPGELGPAIIAGHVDGVVNGRKGQPGIFHRLHELTPGSEVLIERKDGATLRFAVTAIARHAKEKFPTSAVYGETVMPELRLITCGGAFDNASGHYADNWIVWAELVA